MTALTWERIQSGEGRDRHTVYWQARTPLGYRLTVSRVYVDHQPTRDWRWKVYPPKPRKAPPVPPVLEGPASDVPHGRRVAEQAYDHYVAEQVQLHVHLRTGQRVWSQDLPPGSEPTGTQQGTVLGMSDHFGNMVKVEWDDGLVSDEVPGDLTPSTEAGVNR